MANQLLELLQQWYPQRDDTDWVLGTVFKTEGPCYRKAGAMMLFGGMGQQLGLLSGGCLESDIQQHARRIMSDGHAVTLCYDGSDEDDLSFQLGIGCGGTVYILLQPVTRQNDYLGLDKVLASLQKRIPGFYHQLIPNNSGRVKSCYVEADPVIRQNQSQQDRPELVQKSEARCVTQWLITPIIAAPHLIVIGGGLDALPLINIAAEMGWETTLWDPRPANARRDIFLRATTILQCPVEELTEYADKHAVDAVFLMTHNVEMDAKALFEIQKLSLRYIALLGPVSRRKKVLRTARLGENELKNFVSGPAGLEIGGELPESIALSMLAECHSILMINQRAGLLDEAVA